MASIRLERLQQTAQETAKLRETFDLLSVDKPWTCQFRSRLSWHNYRLRSNSLKRRARVWVRRSTSNETTSPAESRVGNKVRKLEYSLAKATQEGADVILSCGATQTNHGRALAALCNQLGFDCHLFLLGDEKDAALGNHLLLRILGAKIDYLDLKQYLARKERFDAAIESYRQAGRRPFLVPVGASDDIGSLGYVMAAQEIAQQSDVMSVSFDHIVLAVGSGGTLAGLHAGTQIFDQPWRVHGVTVCDDANYFRREAQSIFDGLKKNYLPDLQVNADELSYVEGFKGRGYGRSDRVLRRQLVALARECSLVLDPVYTMKAWQGLEHLIQSGVVKPKERVLFIHTGGTSGLLGHGRQFRPEDFES